MHGAKGTDFKSVPFAVGPELSVIIPTLNEAETLPHLLADLAAQIDVSLEIVISDGGSTDATREIATAALSRHGLAGTVLTGANGRGRQLNLGAARAQGDWLLFLHADSRFPSPTVLVDALTDLHREGNPRLAGHFALCFDLPDGARDFNYYWCEVKARCGLPGTIHGDQGILLKRPFFAELGGFREDLPVLEDTLLADTTRSIGAWRLLPGEIVTSPRRFQTEGYRERQTLNALLTNFVMIGWDEPLHRAPDVYRLQAQTRSLQLAPFFRLFDGLLREQPWRMRLRIWYRTGSFVRDNAWQSVLRRTARRAFAAGLPPGAVPLDPVVRFRRRFDRLTDNPYGYAITGMLTWLWFRTRSRRRAEGV